MGLPRQGDKNEVWEYYVAKRLTKRKQGLRPCFICGLRVDARVNHCYGCGKVICHHKKHWHRVNGMVFGAHSWADHGKRWKVKR